MSAKPITFLASFPPIQSAIKIDGSGGARLQLDVSEDYMVQVTMLARLRGKVLLVAVQAEDENPEEEPTR